MVIASRNALLDFILMMLLGHVEYAHLGAIFALMLQYVKIVNMG